jgi:DMSO reductase anchor subunit
VAAKYMLAVVGLGFLFAALVRGGGLATPQSRTWLIVAAIFGAVSVWVVDQTMNACPRLPR